MRKCDHHHRGPSILPSSASSSSISPPLSAGITVAVLGGQALTVESRLSRLGALLQGLGGAPGNSSRFLPGFVTTAAESHGSERRERRGSTRSRMPVMRGLIAPQNTFLDTIATRFDGTRECTTLLILVTLVTSFCFLCTDLFITRKYRNLEEINNGK